MPLAYVSGVLLWRQHPVGYLLSSVLVVKGATFGLALMGMMVGMAMNGVELAIPEMAGFLTLTLLFDVAAIHLFTCLRGESANSETPAHQTDQLGRTGPTS